MLEITHQLLQKHDTPKVMEILINAGVDSLEAAKLIVEALENKKFKPVRFTILWSEGLVEENINFTSWTGVNAQLESIADEHDKDGYTGAYAKTRFEIEFEDGYLYEGRIDVNSKYKNLQEHVNTYLKFHSGVCPSHMTEEEYNGYLIGMNMDTSAATEFLNNYQV